MSGPTPGLMNIKNKIDHMLSLVTGKALTDHQHMNYGIKNNNNNNNNPKR